MINCIDLIDFNEDKVSPSNIVKLEVPGPLFSIHQHFPQRARSIHPFVLFSISTNRRGKKKVVSLTQHISQTHKFYAFNFLPFPFFLFFKTLSIFFLAASPPSLSGSNRLTKKSGAANQSSPLSVLGHINL